MNKLYKTKGFLKNIYVTEEDFTSLFEFCTYTEYEEVLNFILQKQSKLQKTRIANNSPKYIIKQSLYAIAIIAFTFAMAYSAWELQQGNTVTVSGSKKGLKQLLVIIGDTLGVWGSVICGTLILTGFGYYSWKKYQEIKDEHDGYRV